MTQDDIELRVNDNEDATGEGTPIDIIELYVHWRANGEVDSKQCYNLETKPITCLF